MSPIQTAAVHDSVRKLHERLEQLVIAYTGAGFGLPGMLWEQPGASRTLIAAHALYHQGALADYIGKPPEQFVSEAVSIELARAAHRESLRRAHDHHALGLGITATVATDRPKRGDHRVFAAVTSSTRTRVVGVTFEKGTRDRAGEGEICDLVGLNLVLDLLGMAQVPMDPTGLVSNDLLPTPVLGLAVLSPRDVVDSPFRDQPLRLPDGQWKDTTGLTADKYVLFPGSFDPLHDGHLAVAAAAKLRTGKSVVYAIEATHPAKGVVPDDTLLGRANQFAWKGSVLFTWGASLYIEKARRFPGFGFVIGADAVLGLMNPKYYGGEVSQRDAVLEEFERLGTRFYVVGRLVGGEFHTLETLDIPARFQSLFVPLLCERHDVSSSELREAAATRAS